MNSLIKSRFVELSFNPTILSIFANLPAPVRIHLISLHPDVSNNLDQRIVPIYQDSLATLNRLSNQTQSTPDIDWLADVGDSLEKL